MKTKTWTFLTTYEVSGWTQAKLPVRAIEQDIWILVIFDQKPIKKKTKHVTHETWPLIHKSPNPPDERDEKSEVKQNL